MPRPRAAALTAAALLLTTAACSASGDDPDDVPTQRPDTTLVAYWDQHPELAPSYVSAATVLLDERHTGSHTFTLPDTGPYPAVTVGVSCGDEAADRPWIAGFGEADHVWQAQVSSGCGGSGANLGTYRTAEVGAPTRLYVMVDDDVEYSVGVWGGPDPSPPAASDPAPSDPVPSEPPPGPTTPVP